jgi:TetR/AcrR family transcriptional regulator, mexCD-oprJ operon repressor
MRGMSAQAMDHRRAVAERNVEAILDAAEALLERRAQASVTAVAAEAGVSRVTVYAHFPTLGELIEAVVERAVRGAWVALETAEPGRGSPVEALERVVAAGWRELDRNRAVAQAAAEHLSSDAMTRAHETAHRQVAELVERGRAEGAFRTDVPAEWLVTSCFALMHACGDEVRAGRIDAAAAPPILTATIRDLFVGARA